MACAAGGAGSLVGADCAAHNPDASTSATASSRTDRVNDNQPASIVGTLRDRSNETRGSDPGGDRQPARPGSLYVVATPLGNLRDLSARALDVLGSVDRIAAEDTRVTATLLARHGIGTRSFALNAHNEAANASAVIDALARGESVALVTDAGTPAVSDPGARLVRAVRDAGRPVVPVPGPSALVAAVSAAGLVAPRFAFLGFLPPQAKARDALLASVASLPLALVVYEAPHRVRETVRSLVVALGVERDLVVARELTKTFEEIASMRLDEADAWFAADPNRERGEFVLAIDAAAEGARAVELSAEAAAWIDALAGELAPARAARIVAERTGAPREALYARALARRGRDPG